MKKGFKRFLSGALATVMAVAGMTIGMATSAMAADYEYGTVTQTSETVKEWGFTTNMPSGNSNQNLVTGDTINGSITITATGSKANSLKRASGDNCLSIQPDGAFSIPVPANSTGTIYIQATSGNEERNVSFEDGTETKTLIMNTSTTGNSATFTAAATSSGGITLTAAGGECKIGLIRITLDDDFSFGEVTTYNWTLDITGLTDVPADGLALGSGTTTTLNNTLSYSGSGYELKAEYENISDATTGVTVVGTNVTVKPTDEWFNAVAPKTYVSIEPSVSGNTKVYNFVQSDDSEKYLVSVNDTSKSDSTAYADFGGKNGTDNDCYVILDTKGAKLYDDSSSASTMLVIPYTATSGKVTVSGSVTPTNGTGSKWMLVDLGCVSVTTDKNKNVVLASNNDASYDVNAGAIGNKTVTYEVTVDLDAKTASGTIINGDITQTFTDVELGEDSINNIIFITNGSGNVTSGNDRALTIPSVTITTEAVSGPVITKTTTGDGVAVLTDGTNNYVVSIVTRENAELFNTLNQALTTGGNVNATDTVYESIEIGGSIYTATDFYDNANEDDYLFASIIANDNATDAETVISNIQSGITTVLSNENN